MSWYERLIPSRIRKTDRGKIPEGLWGKCDVCQAVLYWPDVEQNANVCTQCNAHLYMAARDRIDHFLDPDGRVEIGENVKPQDFLRFKDTKRYKDRLTTAQKVTNESDALVAMEGKLDGMACVVCAFEFRFIGGSMGSVVGERFSLAAQRCLDRRLPLICFSTSGGARMQEALTSLFQMSKTSAMLAQMAEQNLPYISVLANPTMGGVSASLAMLGDVIIAEPKALIGFAGPRVIQQTVGGELPEGFQTSEFLLEHGAIDMIVPRAEIRSRIASLLRMFMHKQHE